MDFFQLFQTPDFLLEDTVYAIRSIIKGRIYIGQTKNIEARLKDHNAGLVRSTKSDMPCELYALQRVQNRKEAMNLERSIQEVASSGTMFLVVMQWFLTVTSIKVCAEAILGATRCSKRGIPYRIACLQLISETDCNMRASSS